MADYLAQAVREDWSEAQLDSVLAELESKNAT
jgi:hypothetical protein